MELRFKTISCIALAFSIGCSSEVIEQPPEADDFVILDENDFLDAEQRESLQDDQPNTPPDAEPRGIWECIREYSEIDLCSWKQTPDVILLGYLRRASPVDGFYKGNLGADDLGVVDSCSPYSSISHSVEIHIETAVLLKNESDLARNEPSTIDITIDSSFLKLWRSHSVLEENIAREQDFILDGIFKEGQLLGVSLFQHDDGVFSVGHTPLFILDPESDEVVFQKIDTCTSMTPAGWQGRPVDEFISTLNKCDQVVGQDTLDLREYQSRKIKEPRYGYNVCY